MSRDDDPTIPIDVTDTAPAPPPMLEVRDLDAAYGPVQILFGLDLTVEAGEIVALLGTNGAGKSTLFKCITGLLPPRRGAIRFAGQDITGMATEDVAARGVVMMPGGKSVFPTMTVRDNLRLASWLQRRDRAAVAEAEDRVLSLFPRLGQRINQLAGDLSGGEQQMLAISQALIPDPVLLLVDELSLGLAPTVVAQLVDVVHQVHETGLTIVVVEQSVNVALRLAERAVFMEKGTFRFTGPTAELLERPDILRAVFITGAGPGSNGDSGTAPGGDGGDPGARTEQGADPHPGLDAGVESGPGTGDGPETDLGSEPGSRADPVSGAGPGGDAGSGDGPGADAGSGPGPGAGAAAGATRVRVTPPVRRPPRPDAPVVLECRGVTKRFGGITAVDHVDLQLRQGQILGLIGQNGAGKTTLFDCVSGFLEIDAGRILLKGRNITRLPPHKRAERGLGRSFQEARLFPSLTTAETIALARERHLLDRGMAASALGQPVSTDSEQDVAAKVDLLIDLMGLGAFREKLTGELSTGTRRIVELACLLASDPDVTVLDEPSGGVAQKETEALGPLLQRVQAMTGTSILVIEHDMPLLSAICDEMVALELGSVIARGTPAELLAHPRVIESYLGSDLAAINRSGSATVAVTP